jgi:hypothetical protein
MGLYNATGQFAFLIDSDSEIHAKDLTNYVDALGSADFVIGSKRHPLSTVRTPAGRRFLSLGFNILERLPHGSSCDRYSIGSEGCEKYSTLPSPSTTLCQAVCFRCRTSGSSISLRFQDKGTTSQHRPEGNIQC